MDPHSTPLSRRQSPSPSVQSSRRRRRGPTAALLRLAGVLAILLAPPCFPQGSGETAGAAGTEVPKESPALEVETIEGTVTFAALPPLQLEPGDPGRLRAGGSEWPLDSLLFLRFRATPAPPPPLEVILVGGDRLGGVPQGSREDHLILQCPYLDPERYEVALEEIHALLPRNARDDPADVHRLRESLLADRPGEDEIFLKTGGRVRGILDGVDAAGIRFSSERLGKESIAFAWDKFLAVRLAAIDGGGRGRGEGGRAGAARSVLFTAETRNGSRLTGRPVSFDARGLVLEHGVLGRVRIPLGELSEVAARGGRCVFLSDLEPVAVREHLGPLFTEAARRLLAYKRDRNVLGGPLRLGGHTYSKGLGVHAYSRLEYDLGKAYKRFQAVAGLDASAAPPAGGTAGDGGSVVFRVYTDGRLRFEEALSWNDPPRRIDIDVEGAERLVLEVDFGDRDPAVSRDRADWAGARLLR